MHQQTARDIGSIGVADSNQLGSIQIILGNSLIQKLLYFMRPEDEILLIEHPLRQPAEETGHAVLRHIAPNPQKSRSRRQHLAEREQVPLIAARSVEQNQNRLRSIASRLEDMNH
ncbi:hypothetical protein D3C81_134870 [compost metagenome]